MNASPKHILFLARWYPHQNDPMFGLFVKKHAEAVSRKNKVSVLYVQGIRPDEDLPSNQRIDSPNLFTLIYYYHNSQLKLWNLIRYWFYILKGYHYINKVQGLPQVVHVHILTRLGLFAWLLKLTYNIPYVITEHWSRYHKIPGTYNGWARKKLSRFIVKHAHAILPVSKNLEEAMKSHGLKNRNYQIIPNAVDDLFFNLPQNKKESEKTIFLHVSTFEDRSKNISGLLRVIKNLAYQEENFEFWMVGEGIDFQSLQDYAISINILSEQVQFFGLRQGKSLAELYYKANYLILFSNFENIPVVINEAFACGLPVIATNVGGIPEFINSTNGYLVPPKDEGQLETLLHQIIKDKPLFNSTEIQKKARLAYSFDEIGELLDQVYFRCLQISRGDD